MNIIIYVGHVDDETICCGGTILKLKEQGHKIKIVYASNGVVVHGRPGHNYRPHAEKIAKAYQIDCFYFLNIPIMEFDKYGQLELNKRFMKLNLSFDFLITHGPNDVNKDHQIVYESARVLSRYEGKGLLCSDYVGGVNNFNPNFFVDITNTVNKKHEIFDLIKPEIKQFPHDRSHKGLKAKALYWGTKINCNYAEAFECKKWVI